MGFGARKYNPALPGLTIELRLAAVDSMQGGSCFNPSPFTNPSSEIHRDKALLRGEKMPHAIFIPPFYWLSHFVDGLISNSLLTRKLPFWDLIISLKTCFKL